MKKNTLKAIFFICLTFLAVAGVIFTKQFIASGIILLIASYLLVLSD